MREIIVVVGMGAASPLGPTLNDSWEAAIASKCGIRKIEPSELADRPDRAAGQVKDFHEEDYIPADQLPAFHRAHVLSLVAGREALTNSGLISYDDDKKPHLHGIQPEEIGIIIGTGIGGSSSIADIKALNDAGNADEIDPYAIQRLLPERVSTALTIELGITGPAETVSAACATGNKSICRGYDMLINREGYRNVNVVLVGGSEAAITPEGLGPFAAAKMLSKRNKTPLEASQPFNEGANGFVMAEGTTVLAIALESYALARKLPILAKVAGFGNTSDAKDMFFPSGEGALKAMQEACEMAKINPNQIDYINAHAPGTPGDGVELDAIKKLRGGNTEGLSVSSTKGATGHMLGAASAFEAAMCIMAIRTGILPPTLNVIRPIRSGINLVALTAQQKGVEYAMNNAFGLGGINSVVIFKAYHPSIIRRYWLLFKSLIPQR